MVNKVENNYKTSLHNQDSIFKIELFLAVVIASLASLAAFSTLLFCSNDVYPLTADSMGHLTKVRYLADCFSRFEMPSWFPQWYNGSTVMQYYPPLSYLMMTPIEMIFHNVTITFKIFCFMTLFIGGLGVWAFCRKYIGSWCGLFGIVVYCIQPFLTRSLFGAGVLAQGPIFAISPWFILVVMSYTAKPGKFKFFIISISTCLLILSHAMHAFMVCLCIALVLLIFVFIKKLKFLNYFTLGVSMAIGALLAGFWWVVGATGFETPGVPYLLEEATLIYTATLEWFIPGEGNKAGLIFGFSVTIACILAVIVYLLSQFRKLNSNNDKYYVLFNIILTFFTFIFAFGQRIPFFKFIPLYKSLVPGRILSLSAVSAAIVCAYLIYSIYRFSKGKKIFYKSLAVIVCIVIMSSIVIQLNPYKDFHDVMDIEEEYEKIMSMNSGTGKMFEKGRYEWIAPVQSAETYFPVIHGFNTSDGWNIEGTPHNLSIWRYNIALISGCESYVVKDMLFWNVRSILTLNSRPRLIEALDNSIYDFKYQKRDDEPNPGILYTSDIPSSYFLIDKRDCLTLGMGSSPVSLEFPFMVKDYSNNIYDYSIDELLKYKLIFIAEPPVTSLEQAAKIEKTVSELVKNNITVIIEPSRNQNIPLFNVSSYIVNFGRNPQLKRQDNLPVNSSIEKIDFNGDGVTNTLYGLDEIYYKLYTNDNRVENNIIGTKNIDGGKVYFIGMHLSQYLKASTIFINGYDPNETYPYADSVKTLMTDLFSIAQYNKSFEPSPFPVRSSEWNYNGGIFEYSIPKKQEILVSVTYTPRWKITIDGNEVPVKQRENMILLDLPAGDHKVELKYGITKYGKLGYLFTFTGLLILILHTTLYDKFIKFFIFIGNKLSAYLEIK